MSRTFWTSTHISRKQQDSTKKAGGKSSAFFVWEFCKGYSKPLFSTRIPHRYSIKTEMRGKWMVLMKNSIMGYFYHLGISILSVQTNKRH